MPASDLTQLEVWGDVEPANGDRLAVVVDYTAVTEQLDIGDQGHLGREQLTVDMSMRSTAFASVREGRVLRVEEGDGDVTEWRIVAIDRRRTSSGEESARVRCESVSRDLFRRTPFVTRFESGRADIDFNLLRLTPSEWIDDVILATDGFPSWIAKGTVESSDRISAFVDAEPAGPLMDRIAEMTAHEWELRRTSSTGYLLDLVAERGSSTNRPYVALQRNILDAGHRTTAREQATRVYPVGGGPQGGRATMADAKWKVTARSTSAGTVTVADPAGGDGPVAFDDQLGGATEFTQDFWLEKPDETRAQITDSTTGQVLTLSTHTSLPSTGDLVSIRASSSGDELLYLEDPANRATYGLQVRRLDRRDIPNVQNLVSDVATAFLNNWDTGSTGLPNGWSVVGATTSATVSKVTTLGFWRHGGASAKVVASSAGVGLETAEIPISPTSGDPFHIAQVWARADAGTYQVHIVDASNGDRLYPRETMDVAKNSQLNVLSRHDIQPGVDFDALNSTALKVRAVSRGGNATFYLDSAQLLHRESVVQNMYDQRGANALWQAANDELALRGAPEDQYDIDPVDLYRSDFKTYEYDKLDLGQRIIAKDPGLAFDRELRIVGRRRDLTRPGDVRLTLDQRRPGTAERLRRHAAFRQLELADDVPPRSGADRTEGQRLSTLQASFSQMIAAGTTGQWVMAGISDVDQSNVNIVVDVGDLQVIPFTPTQTNTAQKLAVHEAGAASPRGAIKFVVYSNRGFYPHTLLFESAKVAIASTVAADVVLNGPIIEFEVGESYWVGVQAVSSTGAGAPRLAYTRTGQVPMLGGQSVTATGDSMLSSTGNGATVPSVFPGSAVGTGTDMLRFGLQF